MSGRGRPRKVRDENPDTSAAPSPRVTGTKSSPRNQEQVEDKKSTDAKTSRPPKLQERQEPQRPKTTKSGDKKVAPRCPPRKDNSVEENPSKDLQIAPEKAKKSQRSDSVKTAGAKVSSNPKLRSTEETQAPKTEPSGDKKPASISSRRGSSIDENPNKVLQDVLERSKIKKNERSESAKCVNNIQTKITEYIKLHLDWCRDISVLKTGSYYENVKICEPDEFDVMLTVKVDRVNLQPFSEDGAFYSVEMKRHKRHPLDKFVNEDNTIMASEMLKDFREKVKDAVPTLPYDVTLERKKMGCPAVTLLVKENGKNISIDLVLGLEVHSSWPDFTLGGFMIDDWLGKKVRMEQKWKQFYLVPKYEGRGNAEQDGIMAKDAWRISFSHVEKYILKNHGNSKTCCEGGQKCCRKQCLKLLKYLLQQLKEEHREEAEKLCSYHAKTTLLHACAVRVRDSDWASNELSYCFEQLLRDFEQHLRDVQLPNFFIPSQNLLNGISKKKCILLADYIENERNNGFPLLRREKKIIK